MDRFGDADPDVEQAQARDDSANGSIVQNCREAGMRVEEHIVISDARPPGQHQNQHAEVDAEQDEHKK